LTKFRKNKSYYQH